MIAASNTNNELIQYLLDNGADITAINTEDQTAFTYTKKQNMEIQKKNTTKNMMMVLKILILLQH